VADLTAYRIVQESLTNVRKHAGPVGVTLCWTHHPQALQLTIDNTPGRAAGPAGRAGHGLAGMRERVTALGGLFTAGPLPGGGYRVAATLPLTAGAAA
jgi:signal transduction histidine kinase